MRSGQQAALGSDLLALLDALKIETAILGGYDEWAPATLANNASPLGGHSSVCKKLYAKGQSREAVGSEVDAAFDIAGVCAHLRSDPTQHRRRNSFLRRPRPSRMA